MAGDFCLIFSQICSSVIELEWFFPVFTFFFRFYQVPFSYWGFDLQFTEFLIEYPRFSCVSHFCIELPIRSKKMFSFFVAAGGKRRRCRPTSAACGRPNSTRCAATPRTGTTWCGSRTWMNRPADLGCPTGATIAVSLCKTFR